PVPLPIPTEPSETTAIEPAKQGTAPGAAAAPAVPAPPVERAPVPPPPVKASPPAPPPLNRTMIGVGLGPDGRAFLRKPGAVVAPPAPVGAPPAPQGPPSDQDVTATGSHDTTGTQDVTVPGPTAEPRQRVNTLAHGEVRTPGSPYTLP